MSQASKSIVEQADWSILLEPPQPALSAAVPVPSARLSGEQSAAAAPPGEHQIWILKARYADISQNFRAVWDIYIKFYTVFLTFNIAALGLLISNQFHSTEPLRFTICCVFCFLSLLLAATSIYVVSYSRRCANDHVDIEKLLSQSERAFIRHKPGSLPVALATWSGWANVAVMLGMAVIWAVILTGGGQTAAGGLEAQPNDLTLVVIYAEPQSCERSPTVAAVMMCA